MKYISLLLIVYTICLTNVNAQCGCTGAFVGGLSPVGSAETASGVNPGYYLLSAYTKYTYGNEYYAGNSFIPGAGTMKETNYTMFGITADYGLFDGFTAGVELAGASKYQKFIDHELKHSGLSHLSINGKYNVLNRKALELEVSLGFGVKVPFYTGSDTLPLHVRSSQRAYGLSSQFFVHKGFKRSDLHFFLMLRTENLFENDLAYKYGSIFSASIFASKKLLDFMTLIAEVRHEYKKKDEDHDEVNKDSGGMITFVSPKLSFEYEKFRFAIDADYPIYKSYNGLQISTKLSFGAYCSYLL